MKKSRQHKAESKWTPSITEIRGLRFKAYPPDSEHAIIEIVNASDGGRIATLYLEDFRSVEDAVVYARLLALAPLLLDTHMTNEHKYIETVKRFEKILERAKRAKSRKRKRSFTEWKIPKRLQKVVEYR